MGLKIRTLDRRFRLLLDGHIWIIINVANDLVFASSLADRRFVRYLSRMLLDTLSEAIGLLDKHFGGLSGKHSLSAVRPEVPAEWDSGEIIENMRTARRMDEVVIDIHKQAAEILDEERARDFDVLRIRLMNRLALAIQAGKAAIVERWPERWTDELEKEFAEYLDFKTF